MYEKTKLYTKSKKKISEKMKNKFHCAMNSLKKIID